MPREIGTIVAMEANTAVVHFKRSSACGKCKACGALKDMSTMELRIDAYPGAQEGDRVELTMDDSFFLMSAALLYGIPLLMLVLGILGGTALAQKLDIALDHQVAGALTGIVLAFLSFGLLRFFKRTFNRLKTERLHLARAKDEGDTPCD